MLPYYKFVKKMELPGFDPGTSPKLDPCERRTLPIELQPRSGYGQGEITLVFIPRVEVQGVSKLRTLVVAAALSLLPCFEGIRL
jgi:hypothetical protein